jgi:uncharacterized protein (UPF0548 family)
MLLPVRPTPSKISEFLSQQLNSSFSYQEVGASDGTLPPGYNVDHNSVELGNGDTVFAAAIQAIKEWKMFSIGWCEVFPPRAAIIRDTNVAILAHHIGFYSLNASRIVYLIDEEQPVRRFGFAYGTLDDHSEQGEERFSVEMDPNTGHVTYDLLAFSRPRHTLARIGYPFSRMFQKRFARDSKLAMAAAVGNAVNELLG